MFASVRAVLLSLLLCSRARATVFFANNTTPANLTNACTNALLTDVQCSPVVPQFQNGYYYPPSLLGRACTSTCSTALQSYEQAVATACNGQTWMGYDEETDLPLVVIPNLMRYHYDLICLQDSGRWCNEVAAAAALSVDPGVSHTGWSAEPPAGVNASDPCDLCFIKGLQKRAGSPYYDGPELRRQSIYQSKTSSCGVAGYPLTTSTLPFPTPPEAPAPTPSSCAGETYAINNGDTCYTISQTQGIGTGWLLADNNLAAYCADFPASGNLCLVNKCEVVTVKAGDTCERIAFAADITVPQLKAWNPVINAGCYNLEKMNGTSLCVSGPGEVYTTPPVIPTLAPSTADTPAPVPTDAADETNRECGKWYDVVAGDYCNMLTIKYGISLEDFIFLNPSINENCTNLLSDISYCVAPVGDINTYPGRPGYSTPGPTGLPFTKVTLTPTTPGPTATPTPTGLRLALGSREDCWAYFDGSDMQSDISGTYFRSRCELAAAIYGVDIEDFVLWNPEVGNATDAGCDFDPGARYCGKLYFGEPPPPVQGPTTELPVREGASPNCTEFGDVPSDWQCEDVLFVYEMTIAQFYAWNPIVGADCSNLWPGYSYCIRGPPVPGPPTTTQTTSPVTSTGPSPTAPTHPGQPANCIKWHTVVSGDNCASVSDTYFITLAQFFAWNPAVSSDCAQNFWLDFAYCVGTADSATVTRASSAAPTPSSSGAAVPTPNQPNNAISGCVAFDKVVAGDYCAKFAERNGIGLDELFAWNRALDGGAACDSAFWLDYWYCVGVSA